MVNQSPDYTGRFNFHSVFKMDWLHSELFSINFESFNNFFVLFTPTRKGPTKIGWIPKPYFQLLNLVFRIIGELLV